MSEQLNRLEEMMATLIRMQGAQNARMDQFAKDMIEVKADLREVKAELSEVKESLGSFRSETNMRLTRIERHSKLVDVDLDRTMDDVEILKRSNG